MAFAHPLPLAERAVLITGGARRIGAAVARALHAAGANIVVHCRQSRAEADAVAHDLNHVRRDSAAVVQADLLDTSGLPRLVEQASLAFGRLDVLVNNASTFYPTHVGEITEAAWEDLVGTNLKAPMFLSQAAAPEIRVNAIAPGPVLWPEGLDAQLKEKIVESTLLKRPGSPEDVARAALFFTADAPYVTGQVLAVDGGRSLGS